MSEDKRPGIAFKPQVIADNNMEKCQFVKHS